MNEAISALENVINYGNELISNVSGHPAITLNNAIGKKNKDDPLSSSSDPPPIHGSSSPTPMDVDGDLNLMEQINLATKYLADIDDGIKTIYKSVKETYSERFPELNIPDPMQYIMTAQLLGNKPHSVTEDSIKNQLKEFLDSRLHLQVTMNGATTKKVKLEPEIMDKILAACSVAIHINNLRSKLLQYVELHMSTIAPNLSTIVGTSIAAKLMGLTGGLKELANMPSCNLSVLSMHRKATRDDGNTNAPKTGLIFECDLIQQIPFDHTKDTRKKAVRWVANKCVLAARCDLSKSQKSGEAGRALKQKIESLITKELEPPPKKAERPLPAPIEKSGKRRGGKRVRRTKERYAQTELRKAANRMTFGDVGDDAYQNDLGFGRSQLSAIQKLRGPQINEKTKIKLSKRARQKLAKSAGNLAVGTGPARDASSSTSK